MYVCVLQARLWPAEAKRRMALNLLSHRKPKPHRGCWELNLNPLEGQQVPLITEPSLSPSESLLQPREQDSF